MNIEDNQRIKGFKATFESAISNASQIFIVAHNNPDLDAIGSAIGLYFLIKSKFKMESYIIINDSSEKLEAGVKKVIDKEKGRIPFINLNKYLELKGDDDLLILTDVNKRNRISVENHLDDFKDILIIDHHNEDGFTVKADKRFITCGVSSASEIVTRLNCEFKNTLDENTATYLLAGIRLDSNSYNKNCDPDTMDAVKKLLKNGASTDKVLSLFQENYESDVRVSDLIRILDFKTFQYAITVADKSEVYTQTELAKAADRALSYGCDAAFIIGYTNVENPEVGVSARSNGRLNVGKLMEELGGGGNDKSAATSSKEKTAEELGEAIKLKLVNPYIIK